VILVLEQMLALGNWLMARVRALRKTGEVRAAVRMVDRVGVAEDEVVVGVVYWRTISTGSPIGLSSRVV